MIKREHIKQAIDAISGRSPEIGYSLDQMLVMGVIDDYVIPRIAVGTEADRLFPLAQSWDEQWYAGASGDGSTEADSATPQALGQGSSRSGGALA